MTADSVRKLYGGRMAVLSDLDSAGVSPAVTVRSPLGPGVLLDIELDRDAVPGARLVGPSDIPGRRSVVVGGGRVPIFAERDLRYVGEPVGLVVFERDEVSLDGHLKVIAEEVRTDPQRPGSVAVRSATKRVGTPEGMLADAIHLTEGRVSVDRYSADYPEPTICRVYPGEQFLVLVPTQSPFLVRDVVAQALGLAPDRVRVQATACDGHHDARLWFPAVVAAQTAVAAAVVRRPVQVAYTPDEEHLYAPRSPAVSVSFSSSTDESGGIEAIRLDIRADLGAHSVFADEFLFHLVGFALGGYHFPHAMVTCTVLTTHSVPATPVYGFGAVQAQFALETHLSRLYSVAGEDPVTARLDRMLRRGNTAITGRQIGRDIPVLRLIREVSTRTDFSRKYAAAEVARSRTAPAVNRRRKGIAVAVAAQPNVPTPTTAAGGLVDLELLPNGRVEVRTSAVVEDPETPRVWRALVTQALGIDADAVAIVDPDTGSVPDGGPTVLSRNTTITARLIERAAHQVRDQRYGTPAPFTVRRRSRGTLPRWDPETLSGDPFPIRSWAATVVEMDVEESTWTPTWCRITMIVSCGRLLDEREAKRRLRRDVEEALRVACGSPLGPLCRGGISAQADVEVDVSFLETRKTDVAMGLGELALSTVPAAYASALGQALRHYPDRLPMGYVSVLSYGKDD